MVYALHLSRWAKFLDSDLHQRVAESYSSDCFQDFKSSWKRPTARFVPVKTKRKKERTHLKIPIMIELQYISRCRWNTETKFHRHMANFSLAPSYSPQRRLGGVTDRADGGGETDIDSDTYSIEFKRRVRKMLAIMSEKLELIAQIWPRCSGIDRLRIDLCNGAYLVPLSSTVFSITVLDSSKTSKFKVT